MNRRIIPFFLPHQGCPQRCIFCDQAAAAGNAFVNCSASEVESLLTEALATDDDRRPVEAGFFGATFTGLPAERQEELLAPATRLLRAGRLAGIRVSTHPREVTAGQLERLARLGVTTVEVGIDSFSSEVLAAAGRGYDRQEALEACREVTSRGLELVVQLMLFLPHATLADELDSARLTVAGGAAGVRLFPTLVLQGTALEQLWRRGDYRAATIPEAVARTAEVAAPLVAAGIPILRIGLQLSDRLTRFVVAGPSHPALGELCWSRLLVLELARAAAGRPRLALSVAPEAASLLTGHRQAGLEELRRQLPGTAIGLAIGNPPPPEEPSSVFSLGDKVTIRIYNELLRVERAPGRSGDGDSGDWIGAVGGAGSTGRRSR